MKTVSIALLALLLPVAALADQPKLVGAAPVLDKAAGVYWHDFPNGTVDGESYQSEDVFELVKLSPKAAYFRIHSEFFNGHECNLQGIADMMPDALTYYGPADGQNTPCVLKFTANAKGLILDDTTGACTNLSCGARGSIDDGTHVDYPFKARRPIRYMKRLLASREYKAAVAQHGAHAVGTVAPN